MANKFIFFLPILICPILLVYISSTLILPELPLDVVNSLAQPYHSLHQTLLQVSRKHLPIADFPSLSLLHRTLESWRFIARMRPPSGSVESCCCEVELIEHIQPSFHQLLSALTTHPFFKFFLVNYEQPCPFWVEEHLCSAEADGPAPCGICECPLEDVPPMIQSRDVNRTLTDDFRRFSDRDDSQWIEWDHQTDKLSYVNLELNPERYTGYQGTTAREIWKIIYEENCFGPSEQSCVEERVFFRIISGLHGSTTAHLSAQHQHTQAGWVPNLDLFIWRLGVFPDRLKNIYFNYVFLLRAVSFLKPLVAGANTSIIPVFATGLDKEDEETSALLLQFFQHPVFDMESCAGPIFDESSMFRSPESQFLRDEFRSKFRNISRIMDCVACESCKLHAKLQVLGLGTALKILFHQDPRQHLVLESLQRNEVMALFQTFFKFSESIHLFHQMIALEKIQLYYSLSAAFALTFAFIIFLFASLKFVF